VYVTYRGQPIHLKLNMDVVPYWILQDPQAAPYDTIRSILYGLNQSPLKFQLHLTKTLDSDGGRICSIHQRCLSLPQAPRPQVQLCLDPDDLQYFVNCQTMVNEFK